MDEKITLSQGLSSFSCIRFCLWIEDIDRQGHCFITSFVFLEKAVGIPEFWLQVFKNSDVLAELIKVIDEKRRFLVLLSIPCLGTR